MTKIKDNLDKVNELVEEREYNKAIDMLTKLLESEKTVELYMKRANLYSKVRQYGLALGDYRKIVELDPENHIAKTKIEFTENILSIENTFYYENAYTDDSLYPDIS